MRHRRGILVRGLVAIGLIVGSAGAALAGTWPGGAAAVTAPGYGPGGMVATPGPGGPYGYGAGPGWGICGSGYGRMMGGWTQSVPRRSVRTLTQAQQQVQDCLDQMDNPALAVDAMMQFQFNFYAIVKDTRTGHGAFEVLVKPASGAVSLEPI